MGTKATPQTERLTRRTRTYQCPPDHPHASTNTLTCYTVHRCGCDDCTTLQRTRNQQYRKLRAYGRHEGQRVDATAVREHLDFLLAHGIGTPQLSKLAGVSSRTLQGIRQQRYPKMQKRFVSAVLAVQPSLENMADGALVPARGVARRLQALVAVGWTQTAIGQMWGQPPQVVHALIHARADGKVTVKTHRELADLYERISHLLPPKEDRAWYGYIRSVRLGERNKWIPPLAWDDIDNDPTPPTSAVNHHTVGIREREAMVRDLHAQCLSDRAIAERLGIADRTVFRIRHRLGLRAWTKEQQEAA